MSYTTETRWLARLVSVILWAVGSIYLVKNELATSSDMVLVATMPVIWLAVIAMAILAGSARRERKYLTSLLLALAATVGASYTLSCTIARQSEVRDIRVATFEQDTERRSEIEKLLLAANEMLAKAREKFARECATGLGTRCKGIKATIDVYEAAKKGHEYELATLSHSSPKAGEKRIAAALAMMIGGKPEAYEEAVGLFLPSLLGMFAELGAAAAALYGWHSTEPAKRRLPSAAKSAPPRPPQTPNRNLPDNVVQLSRARSVVHAIERAGGSVQSNNELARILGVSPSHATKLRRREEDRLSVYQEGNEKRISVR